MSDETAGAPGDQQPGDQQPDPQPAVTPPGSPEHSAAAEPQNAGPPSAGPGYHQPQYGAPGYGAPGYGAPEYGAPQYGSPQYDANPYSTAQYGGAQNDGAQYGGAQNDGAQYGGAQYGAGQYAGGQYGPVPYGLPAPSRPGSGLAVTALVLGIVALLSSWVPFLNIGSILLGLVGLVLGIVALSKVRRGTGGGKGLAIGGAVTSVLAIVVSIVVLVAFVVFIRDASTTVTDAWEDIERESTRQAAPVDPATVLALGESVELDSYTVSVTAINPAADDVLAQTEGNPPPHFQFALVDLSVTYRGTDDPTETGAPWMHLDVELAGANGISYSSLDCDASTPRNAFDVEDLTAGESADIQVCLDAPARALTGGHVVVSDLFSFTTGSEGIWAVP